MTSPSDKHRPVNNDTCRNCWSPKIKMIEVTSRIEIWECEDCGDAWGITYTESGRTLYRPLPDEYLTDEERQQVVCEICGHVQEVCKV